MKAKRLGLTTKFVVIACLFMLLVNATLGMVLMQQSRSAMKTLIHNHMLDLSNTAAAFIDGDQLGSLTKEDEEGDLFHQIEDQLLIFQKNNNIQYIYAVKAVAEKEFVFTVDPDPVDPGAFGEPVVYTDALYYASKGTPSIDETAFTDRWGSFYSAYSPVYNSKGEIIGIIGVDFDAEWFNSQITQHTVSVIVISVVSLLIGGLIVVLLNVRLSKRIRELNADLGKLSSEVDELTDEFVSRQDFAESIGSMRQAAEQQNKMAQEPVGHSDAIEALSARIRTMQCELRTYINYMHAQAYADTMTGVGNRTAYLETVKRINAKIASNEADFAVAVFDINGLKATNDTYGHEFGDALLIDAATVLKSVFGADNIYRIGGDEFIVVLEENADRLPELLIQLDKELATFNRNENSYHITLSLSKGSAVYGSDDIDFRTVFKRADEAMYKDKAEFYQRNGDRRDH